MSSEHDREGALEETWIPLIDKDSHGVGNSTTDSKEFDVQLERVEGTEDAKKEHLHISPSMEMEANSVPICSVENPAVPVLNRKRYLGLSLSFLSALMFSLNALIVKLFADMHPFNICMLTFPISASLTIPVLLYSIRFQKLNVFQNVFPVKENLRTTFFIFLRAFTSVGALILLYFSMKYLDVGDAIVIASSSTVFVYFVSWMFLREEISCSIIVTGLFTLAGVVIIARPPLLFGTGKFDVNLLIGAGLASGCMMLMTIAMIAVRFLQNVHHALLNLVLYSWGSLQSFLLAVSLGVFQIPQGAKELSLIMVSGVLNFLALTSLAIALQCEQAGPVALVRTCEVIFAFIWQIVFLSVVPDILSFTGALMIVVGVVITIARKWILSLPEGNRPGCFK